MQQGMSTLKVHQSSESISRFQEPKPIVRRIKAGGGGRAALVPAISSQDVRQLRHKPTKLAYAPHLLQTMIIMMDPIFSRLRRPRKKKKKPPKKKKNLITKDHSTDPPTSPTIWSVKSYTEQPAERSLSLGHVPIHIVSRKHCWLCRYKH
jgi:hypothetical protein